MSIEPLPKTLDMRKAAARGVSIQGTLKPLELQRFGELLASTDGTIEVKLAFQKDEENRYVVDVDLQAKVAATCQRCLESMPVELEGSNRLAVVWTDDEARHLPRHLDPVVSEEVGDLWEMVEDELILAMPSFSVHSDENCNEYLAGLAPASPEEEADSGRSNPFDVLAQLKPGKE